MNIIPTEVTVRDLVEGYTDNGDGGVIGYAGMLDIRPAYQREFVYSDKQAAAVIDTVNKKFPLNVMYWADRGDGQYEIIDGQQRTLSLCMYVAGDFSVDHKYFHTLQDDQKNRILDYRLTVYLCEGTASEKLDWFRIINIAGEKLNEQELRNATYHGSWVTDAKRFFSRTNGPAHGLASAYLTGTPNRQDYLETAIEWVSDGKVLDYMSSHQHDINANQIELHFRSVINWVETTFPKPLKEMRSVAWGELYREHGARALDSVAITARVAELMADEEVSNKKGIYSYVLDGEPKHLNLRAFSPAQRREAYERQAGICVKCSEHFEIEDMQADHIIPWIAGGRTVPTNCQMLCQFDNGSKGGR